MKFTLSWLKEHLDTEATVEEIAEALTDLGLEVEGVSDPAEVLGAFTVGEVLEAEKHPDADRLRVCRVLTAKGEQQIICGAPNARAGIKVVVAQPGDYIPGIDVTIQVGKIRGIESHGMMLSEREMQLSDAHEGIVELGADAVVGQRYIDYAGKNDPMIHVAITPNRPDALGVRGIARDLAARGLGTLKPQVTEPVPGSYVSPVRVTLDDSVSEKACSLFLGRMIRGVKNGPSPAWLQDRLRAIGLRPISALVDVTNFLTYDQNRPLHVFDADKVSGDLVVRRAEAGETLLALDEKTYTFEGTETVIADDNGVESIGGIMGGHASGCTTDTVNVFLEAAYFDPVLTAETGRKLKINSDARYRFERGIDPTFTPEGIEIATRMILDLCGGEASEVVTAGAVPDVARFYRLNSSRVSSLVGMDIPEDDQIRILTALGFGVAKEAGGVEVWVPSWRPDVQGEADLVEEIARITSLTRLEGRPMARAAGVQRPILTLRQLRESTTRRRIASLGYNECVTYSFIDERSAALFGGGTDAVKLGNPISSEMSHLRPDLLPGLLQAAARNQARGFGDLMLFEVGPAWTGGEPEDQLFLASGLRVGHTAPRNAFGSRRPVDVFDAKADAEAVLAELGAPAKLMVLRNAPGWFHPGRSGVLSLGPKTPLAVFGELHPRVLDALDVKGPAVAFTLFPMALPQPKKSGPTRPALEISDFQAVERDFAFVVDAEVAAEAILKAAQGADKALVDSVSVFDVFAGERAEAQMGAGKKSVAIAVRLQPRTGTLTDKEIEAAAGRIVAAVTKATGGTLRG
ncbi:phenylalanine--tRNA ligase subunit beta [Halovulum dunhuangense]|uniref:Phenylalanine--tRNA ligase beta subunit n=1 Tax=Halovulum dunhuangense TaxID=1505036 RepID=A0A849KRB1_9RHOB|nr:phenylalanine--tRNA ligase subunit beta [Halovulum dunhuangense]NNU79613.1 phenylalanine--tRNA ligase subunit beta [Halovulum dunhuangense]